MRRLPGGTMGWPTGAVDRSGGPDRPFASSYRGRHDPSRPSRLGLVPVTVASDLEEDVFGGAGERGRHEGAGAPAAAPPISTASMKIGGERSTAPPAVRLWAQSLWTLPVVADSGGP